MKVYSMLQHWKNRKYLRRIFLSVTVLVTLLMAATIISVQLFSEKAITELQMAEDMKTLNQINYNINLISDMVKSTVTHLYHNPDFNDLLYGSEFHDQQLLIRKVENFRKVIGSSSFLNSAVMYNGVQNRYYATVTDQSELGNRDVVQYYLDRKSDIPILKLEPIYIEDQIKLFMMAYYDIWTLPSLQKSAVIITIRPEWLFENIEMINTLGGQGREQMLFVMNEEGKLFNTSSTDNEGSEKFRSVIMDYIQETGNQEGFFLTEEGEEKYSISFLTANKVGWKIITVQSYDKLVGNLATLRKTTTGIGITLLSVALILSLLVTLGIYNPISRVVRQFRGLQNGQSAGGDQDEIMFMTQRYQAISNENFQLKHNVAKHYHLRQLVMDSSSYNHAEMKEVIKEYDLKLGEEASHVLLLIQIDHYEQIVQNPSMYDAGLYKFAVTNITEEIISAGYLCEVLDLRNDHIAAIINLGDKDAEHAAQLRGLASSIQEITRNYYRLSLTITISDPFTGYMNISDYYERCLYMSKYRIAYADERVITSELIQTNEDSNVLRVQAQLQEKLLEQIKANQSGQSEETLQAIFNEIRGMKYSNMINSVLQFVHLISDFITTMNEMKLYKVQVDTKDLYQEVLEKETLDEMQQLFRVMFRSLGSSDNEVLQKSMYLIENVKSFIEESYQDLNLNLEFIASYLKMSPGHLSKVFKQTENESITDYINEVRLGHTLKLLNETDLSAKEIMGLVGFGSESYFYRLFKKRFGVTPKQYQLKSSMRE